MVDLNIQGFERGQPDVIDWGEGNPFERRPAKLSDAIASYQYPLKLEDDLSFAFGMMRLHYYYSLLEAKHMPGMKVRLKLEIIPDERSEPVSKS